MNWELLYTKLINERSTSVGERHHIIPKSLGGDDSSSNLVILSHTDHTLAHYIRYRWLGLYQDKVAYKMMSGQIINPMHDDDLYSEWLMWMNSDEAREIYSTAAIQRWSNEDERNKQSFRRKKWMSDNGVNGMGLVKHLITPEMIALNKDNFKKWANANPDEYQAALDKAHITLRNNIKSKSSKELKEIYSRGNGSDNPNWKGYVVIENGKTQLIYDDMNDASSNAPIGYGTMMKCINKNIPVWFGKYKGYTVKRVKELI